jgi:hypothetical protein
VTSAVKKGKADANAIKAAVTKDVKAASNGVASAEDEAKKL